MPDWMPNSRAAYEAVATTARCVGSPAPPTTTGRPRSSGCRASSTAAMNWSRSTCRIHTASRYGLFGQIAEFLDIGDGSVLVNRLRSAGASAQELDQVQR